MIDRGGFDYTIKVRDQFTKQIRKFRSEIEAARKELGGLRSAQAATTAARRQASNAQSAADRDQLARARSIQAAIKEQQRVEKLRADILRTQQQESSRAARQEISLFRQRAAEQAKATKATQAQAAAQAKANEANKKNLGFFGRLAQSAGKSSEAVNRVSFSFRRLIGIFAVFQAARAGGQLFTGLVRDSINYSRTLEDSNISLAALFSTVGQIEDSQGRLVEGAAAFGAAQQVAAEQTKKLQAEAVNTVATFEELLRAFQAGVGPGLEAGLNLDQIRQVTVQVSQAAAALAIPQNQLIEEIRSLLRGTIQARTTIVASVLGITNEDIRAAKEAGNLFEFLQERLAGFRFAAQATQQSLTGLRARLSDAFQIAGGAASVELFNQLKISLEELSGSFLTLERDSEGKIENILPNEEAVRALTGLFAGLGNALTILREGFAQTNFETLGTILSGIGASFEFVAAAAAGFGRGFADSLADAIGIIQSLVNQLGGGDGVLFYVEAIFEFFGQWAAPIAIVAATLAAMRGTLFFISPLTTAVAASMKVARVAAVGLFNAIRLVPGPALGVVGAIAGAAVAAELFAEKLLGAKGSFLDIGELAGIAFEQTFTELFGLVDRISTEVSVAIRNAFDTAATAAKITIREIKAVFDLQLGASQELAQLANDEKARANADDLLRLKQATKARELEIEESKKRQKQIDSEAEESAAKRLAALQAEVDVRTDDPVLARIQEAFGALGQLSGINFDELSTDFAEGTIDPEKIAERMEKAIQEFIIKGRGGKDTGKEAGGPLETYLNGIVTNFENGLSIMRGLVQSFSSFVSDSITDALDPNSDKSLKQRFGEFLRDIAKLIIDQLVQVAIAKAVLGLTSSGTPKVDTGGITTGLAEGGPIPDGHSIPRMARPKGLDPRDTTPIMAQPGEWMMRLAAVKRYGADVMDAINRGLIDPGALNALVSGRSRRHLSGISPRGPRGYAEGGIIQQAANTVDRAVDRNDQQQQPVMAALVANDQTFEKLIHGGRQAFNRYLQDNAAEIDGILRSGRTGG